MNRILIVGPGGAGKSTLARRLGAALGLPVIHLDVHYWKPGWVETDPVEWRAKLEALTAGGHWIMDGNFGASADLRFPRADTIVFLDPPRWVCLWRWTLRYLKYRKGGRPDMTAGCDEKLDRAYLKWIWDFDRASRPKLFERVERFGRQARFVRLRSSREVERFVASATRDRVAPTRAPQSSRKT